MQHLSRPQQFLQKHPNTFPTEAGLRWFIFKNRAQLESSGALVKNGRRLFINEDKFFAVLTGGQGGAA
ncbi:hypothetical protein [Thioalkalivibrio sp. ALJ15]|uniref:hypothetical protein n=1 Tax=Thioalkalivibrio sp. ALJ15 TaxID=748652 RepID=UPI000364DC98|nr:hypothetical protein [Thioalkalivibrio sp. ALJ15]